MFLQMASGTEIALIFGFLVILILGVLFHAFFIEKPRQKKEKEDWIKNNKKQLSIQNVLTHVIEKIGQNSPPCPKCGSTSFQLWKVANSVFKIRCVDCRKESKERNIQLTDTNDEPLNLQSYLGQYAELVNFTSSLHLNSPLGQYLNNHLIWDFTTLRTGQPVYRAIKFETNPDYVLDKGKYDNIKNDEPSRRIPQRVMDKVWNRDGGKCIQCGSNEKLEFDHIIPFSKGGANTYRNIQLLCENCNRTKSDKIG